jgi:predicted Zn-dependent protease
VNPPRLTLAALLLPLAGGCSIEPFADPITIPAGYVPPGYSTYSPAYTPTSPRTTIIAPPATAPSPQIQPVIDDKTRDQILAAALAGITKRFGIDPDPKLNEYLILVGSLVTINTSRPDVEYAYILLNTNQPVSCACWPKTICLSRGLITRMEDESELAGVIAREISNLIAARALKAAGLPLPSDTANTPVTTAAPAVTHSPSAANTALVNRLAAKLTDILLKDGLTPEQGQAADVEGAKFAAAARYAPDGLLRFLTRQQPDTGAATTTRTAQVWERIKVLNANVQIVAKAYPHSDARLPARFESYLKSAPKPAAAANP